ncbi:DUF4102 domain-containing protein [Acetobacteraceae bacterium]|nr:DUF4102 domain-containing protein [Acetobacteraceae bacterium]
MSRKKSGQLFSTQLRQLPRGDHGDGGGLYLVKEEQENSGKWVFRFTSPLSGKRRRMGMGAYPEVSLANARDKALAARSLLSEYKDPIEERRKEEYERKKSHGLTFEECALKYISAKCKEWKGEEKGTTYRKHKGQLELHVFPSIGKRPVAGIDKHDIIKILEPVFHDKKGRTAEKLIEYIKSVLDYAKAHNWREGENPAEWRGNLDKIFPAPSKIAPVKHHDALDYRLMPLFMAELKKSQGLTAIACRFAILNASRSGEARGARWEEIDLEKKLWTIPAKRIKANADHTVTLSRPALELLNEVKPLSNGAGLIFPNSKGKPFSDNGLLKAAKLAGKAIGSPAITLHGFRASFRTWTGEETDYPREVAEHALSHAVGGSVERAYSRGTMEDKRRPLMEAWGRFCMGENG